MRERYRQRRRGASRKQAADSSARQLARLVTAAALFLACLLGRVCFPAQTEEYRSRLAQLLAGDTDVREAFLQLGEGLEEGERTLEAVGDWCAAVFAPEEVTLEDTSSPGDVS